MKESQSLIDFLQNIPLAHIVLDRSGLSNREAQTLYNIWTDGDRDEYGRFKISREADPLHVTSLTTKGYVSNNPSRYAADFSPTRTLEFTDKGRDVISKIILHKEKSVFEKSSNVIDYQAICRASIKAAEGKIASVAVKSSNWLQRLSSGSNFKV